MKRDATLLTMNVYVHSALPSLLFPSGDLLHPVHNACTAQVRSPRMHMVHVLAPPPSAQIGQKSNAGRLWGTKPCQCLYWGTVGSFYPSEALFIVLFADTRTSMTAGLRFASPTCRDGLFCRVAGEPWKSKKAAMHHDVSSVQQGCRIPTPAQHKLRRGAPDWRLRVSGPLPGLRLGTAASLYVRGYTDRRCIFLRHTTGRSVSPASLLLDSLLEGFGAATQLTTRDTTKERSPERTEIAIWRLGAAPPACPLVNQPALAPAGEPQMLPFVFPVLLRERRIVHI